MELYGTRRPPGRKKKLVYARNRSRVGNRSSTSSCIGRNVRQFEKEVSFRLQKGVGYVTQNCRGRAVRQFDIEVSFKLGTGVENVTSNCMGRAVRQVEKEVSFRPVTGEISL